MPEETELSEREREILRLVATGASNKEIAARLVISPNTVKVHLRNIFAKVGVASRTEATLYALRTGLLASPAPHTSTIPAEPAPAVPVLTAPVDPAPASTPAAPGSPFARRGLLRAAEVLLLVALLAMVVVVTWAALTTPPPAGEPPAATGLPAAARLPERWSALPAPPVDVRAAAGAVYENRLYILAGDDMDGCWVYDLAANRWSRAAPKPTPVSHAGAALLGEKIYVAGGRAQDGAPTTALEVYDPRSDTWQPRAALPAALEGAALVSMEGRLYLFGGWDGQQAVAGVYAYAPDLDRWEVRSALPQPRAYAAAAGVDGKIVLAGGQNADGVLDSVLHYFPTRDAPGGSAWQAGAPLPGPRAHASAASLAGVLYLVGGEAEAPLEYLAQTGEWVSFDAPPLPAGPLPLLLALNTHLYLLGEQAQAYQAIYNLSFPVIR